jgi:hypothetical protein
MTTSTSRGCKKSSTFLHAENNRVMPTNARENILKGRTICGKLIFILWFLMVKDCTGQLMKGKNVAVQVVVGPLIFMCLIFHLQSDTDCLQEIELFD